ncbi:efflux RND transporter periplasmic adaptor subunit [Emcibacter sp. SYSU 3D8]|uniref:efflux RND transporter periplasmic adaptor subunit n=1 Tax=Emcibacter sp. SYSU 3D8 TaxID=3133969 RepID=UPI0031FF12D5
MLAACDSASQKMPAPQPVPVVSHTIQPGEFVERIEAIGTLHANESVTLSAKVTEKVARVHFQDGQTVARGQVLIEFTNDEEGAMLAEARATQREAEQQLERVQELSGKGYATKARLDEQSRAVDGARARARAMEARMSDRVLRAPFDGVLGFRQVSPGTLVSPGTAVATLDDIDPVKLDFSVPETFLGAIAAGQDVDARTAAYPGRAFKGVIETIDARVDPISRAISVRALIPNGDGALRPGMLVTVEVIQSRSTVLLLPEGALVPREKRQFVWVIGQGGTVTQREVTIGRRHPGVAELLGGLRQGETVVVEGVARMVPGGLVQSIGTHKLPEAESGGA